MRAISQENEINDIHIGEEVQLPLVKVKYFKWAQELIAEFHKLAGYQINMQNLIALLQNSNQQLENEIKIPLNNEILSEFEKFEMNLKMLGLYPDNYKTLLREIKYLNTCREKCCTHVRRFQMQDASSLQTDL